MNESRVYGGRSLFSVNHDPCLKETECDSVRLWHMVGRRQTQHLVLSLQVILERERHETADVLHVGTRACRVQLNAGRFFILELPRVIE